MGQSRIDNASKKMALRNMLDAPKNKSIDIHCDNVAFRSVTEIIKKPLVKKPARTPKVIQRRYKQTTLKLNKKTADNEIKTIQPQAESTEDNELQSDLSIMDRDNTTSADTDIPCKRKTLPVEETAIKKQKASHHQELTIPSPTNSQQEEVDILSVSQQEESVDTPADSQQEKSADTPADSQQEESVDTSTDSHQQEVDTHTDIIVVQSEKSTTVSPVAIIDKHPSPKEEITEVISQNTPHLSSPVHTPPTDYGEVSTPPQKTYISKTDKMRMEYERTTLTKVRKALDIVITDRLACNRPALYHQIESVLCNSTQRTITLTHICQIMFLAPNLYTLEAKELRNYGGKVTEAHLIKFAPEWKVPLSGKNLHEREVILDTALINYFQDKVMPTIPAIPIPTLATINKDQWCEEAKLPSGVKGLLTALKKKKELAAAQEAPKVEHKGTVEDRMAALRARLLAKKMKKDE